MELISVENSSILKLMLISRPQGQTFLPHLVTAVQEKFQFQTTPEDISSMDSGLEFTLGFYDDVVAEKLVIYSDGVTIQGKSPTEKLELFLGAMIGWASSEFGVSIVKTHAVDTIYESNITVCSEAGFAHETPAIVNARKHFRASLKKCSSLDVEFFPVGFSMAPELTKISGLKPAVFQVNRRGGVDFNRNLFTSTAPLTTEMHLEILRKLEAKD
jgi:hypothetical protein